MAAAPACCGMYSKHVILINNVYPKEPGEEGPRGSALSLVIFYATTKPYKLPKIGTYLERRVKLDTKKCRYGYIRVTLQVLHSLLSECRQNSNLISKSILRIILDVLHSPDPDLVMQATGIFILFSAHHNHQNIIDNEFTEIYSLLIKKFCTEAAYECSDSNLQHKTRLSGLKALEAVCDSESFIMSPNLVPYSQQIIPAALANMRSRDKRPDSTGLRQSITDQLITDDELKLSANICIRGLFRQANVANVKSFLLSICGYLDEKDLWSVSHYALDVIQSVVSVVQTQYHYIILSIMLERLESETHPTPKTTVVRVLTFLITSGEGIAGLTIPELLETFVRHLCASVDKHPSLDENDVSVEHKLQQALINAIGSLSHHLVYPSQLNDIISYLVNRLLNLLKDIQPCVALIRSLESVMTVYGRQIVTTENRRQSMVPTGVSVELVTPTLVCMSHSNANVRLAFFGFLSKTLSLLSPNWRDRNKKEAISFHGSLWHTLHDTALQKINHPFDFVIVGRLAVQLLHVLPAEDLLVSVPIFFRLQTCLIEKRLESIPHTLALASLIVEYFIHIAGLIEDSDLVEYTNKAKKTMIENQQWLPRFELTHDAMELFSTKSFKEAELDDMKDPGAFETPLERSTVIGMLTRCKHLKDTDNAETLMAVDILPWEQVVVAGAHIVKDLDPTEYVDGHLPLPSCVALNRSISLAQSLPPVNVNLHSTGRSASEHPYSTVGIEDLKDALADGKSKTTASKILDTSNIDISTLSSDGVFKDNVSSLLKNITATFGKSAQASVTPHRIDRINPKSETVELDWLTARSKDMGKDAQSSPRMARLRSASQQRMRTSESNFSLRGVKLREPDMLSLESGL
ncbi:hypothetical protein BASA50_006555 [Batrachochytrium salamandrivorans]|uniref:Protein EFR3 n=1 Tax=Batrachochytrium salamandrivorans TaxID=1357716 RepID=A0ABQ8FB28_9FUNG|nr:hypothetical protein BASA62_009205 [Batrachochytrium salamandrivorans]KAH6577213.1 hypothetical protein BASA60_004148 [Batrachochytrium salamandrivorans]KAH6582898.1 hypothetical protein BASA61_008310 [Batrachochytrium salamandrivorans]KAH6594606.1 hypothetical protein BASA50_006555 [Batrachochytrium salamandrivorans]KAJ1340630.1 hypothetical protein BSLG_004724 [Batrachochytrium salamandrivorans]